jgi:hypothetical protein
MNIFIEVEEKCLLPASTMSVPQCLPSLLSATIIDGSTTPQYNRELLFSVPEIPF